MKLAVAQLDLSGSLRRNLEKMKAYAAMALEGGIELLAFPETALTGYIYEQFSDVDYGAIEDALARLQDAIARTDLCLIVGTPMKTGGHMYNSAAVLFPDGKRAVYHKRFLTDYESSYFEHGEKELLFTHGGHAIGILICRDQNRPDYTAELKSKGARVVFILSAHHYELIESKMKREKNIALPIARAYENNLFVCKANSVGTVRGKISYGNSMIIDPRGIVVTRGGEHREELLSYEADLGNKNLKW
jgi:NAD+ synthase (glutamine-hydrolysing)